MAVATATTPKLVRGRQTSDRKRLQNGDTIWYRSGDDACRAVFIRIVRSGVAKVLVPKGAGRTRHGVFEVSRKTIVRRKIGDVVCTRSWADVAGRDQKRTETRRR